MILLLLGLAERQLGTRRTAVFYFAAPVRGRDAVPAAHPAGPLCRRRLAQPDGRRAADGPVRGGPRRLAGVQRAAAHAVATAAAHRRRLHLPLLVLYVGHAETVVGFAGALAGLAAGWWIQGDQGHPAPPPLHGPRDPQPAGAYRGDLRRRTDPDRRPSGPPPGRWPCCATSC